MNFSQINYEVLPEGLRSEMRLYIEEAILPGGFLREVIQNNFVGAVGRADSINKHRLYDIASFMYNEAPAPCWGSRAKIEGWVKDRMQEREQE